MASIYFYYFFFRQQGLENIAFSLGASMTKAGKRLNTISIIQDCNNDEQEKYKPL